MRELFVGSVVIGNLELAANPDIERYVHDDLIKKLAASIVNIRITKIKNEFSVNYGYGVIVADPDDYWRDVEMKAMELQSRLNYNHFYDQKREDS